MIYLIGYIVGVVLTLVFWLWYCSRKRRRLGRGAIERIIFLSALFPIVWALALKDMLINIANFMYCEMRMWRKKHDKK